LIVVVSNFVAYNLRKILQSRVKSQLRIDALIFFFGEVQSIDKARGCLPLRIGRCYKRGELVVADIFICWKLHKVEQRLPFVDVRE